MVALVVQCLLENIFLVFNKYVYLLVFMLVHVTIITQPITVMITRIDYGSCSHIVKKSRCILKISEPL